MIKLKDKCSNCGYFTIFRIIERNNYAVMTCTYCGKEWKILNYHSQEFQDALFYNRTLGSAVIPELDLLQEEGDIVPPGEDLSEA